MSKTRKFAMIAAAMAPAASALAEGEVTVAPAVTTAITKLESGATAYAGAILPYIAEVGLAFIGISVVYLLFRVFKRFVSGK